MTMALKDVLRAKAMTCQSTQASIPQFLFALHGNQVMTTEMDMPQSLESNLEKRQKQQSRRQKEQSRNRASDLLSSSLLLKPVASVVEGSDLDVTEDPVEPTASCINGTRKRQLVTRSGLPRLRCCVPFPPQASNEVACCCSRIFQKRASTGASLQG